MTFTPAVVATPFAYPALWAVTRQLIVRPLSALVKISVDLVAPLMTLPLSSHW